MWSAGVFFLTHIVVCQFATENPPASTTTTEDQTVTSFYALTTGLAPAPIMLRLGNSTIDSTKSFKVPQPTENHVDTTSDTNQNDPVIEKVNPIDKVKIDVIPHVISAKNTYFDHDRRYGPTFEDAKDGNITKVTVQLGEDGHLNCRISLLQDKTVSWVRRRGRDEMPELLTVGAVTYAADNRVTVARRYPGNWRLLIREVKPDDEGVYECQISTHPPRVSRTYLHVNNDKIIGAQKANLINIALELCYENKITIKALSFDGFPANLAMAKQLGCELQHDSVKTEQVAGGADSLLRLARVNSSDAGNYTCAVRGARSHTVSVHVLNESLAELHAGATSKPPSVTTIITLITLTVVTNQVNRYRLQATLFLTSLFMAIATQSVVRDQFIVTLPT
ncbi:uncharacterized protein LOC113240357 [Hyposmocoma kahamanoa]|uniref:uncharacterized protein LOC113240357 n=1 Tax=Hyposmocoma kahamanoa TaxID=1477025 RepID=UPI000E6D6901|nr:uncharacterized protein LOC113240357 [Hyposmocoma kahamanoa]